MGWSVGWLVQQGLNSRMWGVVNGIVFGGATLLSLSVAPTTATAQPRPQSVRPDSLPVVEIRAVNSCATREATDTRSRCSAQIQNQLRDALAQEDQQTLLREIDCFFTADSRPRPYPFFAGWACDAREAIGARLVLHAYADIGEDWLPQFGTFLNPINEALTSRGATTSCPQVNPAAVKWWLRQTVALIYGRANMYTGSRASNAVQNRCLQQMVQQGLIRPARRQQLMNWRGGRGGSLRVSAPTQNKGQQQPAYSPMTDREPAPGAAGVRE